MWPDNRDHVGADFRVWDDLTARRLAIKPLPGPFPWRRVVARFAGFVALVVICCLAAVGCWRVP